MYTWNLHNVINQCHPDKFNLKKHLIKNEYKSEYFKMIFAMCFRNTNYVWRSEEAPPGATGEFSISGSFLAMTDHIGIKRISPHWFSLFPEHWPTNDYMQGLCVFLMLSSYEGLLPIPNTPKFWHRRSHFFCIFLNTYGVSGQKTGDWILSLPFTRFEFR